MYNNIEYNKLIEFIDQDIIKNKIINYSTIKSNSLFGGSSTTSIVTIFNPVDIVTQTITKNLVSSLSSFLPSSIGGPLSSDIFKLIVPSSSINIAIIIPVAGYLINLILNNQKKITSQDSIISILKILSFVGLCLGIANSTDIFKLVSQIFTIGDLASSGINTILALFFQGKNILKGGQINKTNSNLYGGNIFNLKEFTSYIWSCIEEMSKNLGIQKIVNSFKAWLNNPESPVPEIDKDTINEIDKIVGGVIKKDVKKLEQVYNYYFDRSSGKIIYTGESNFKEIRTLISINDNYHIKSIEMITNQDKSIHYLINNSDKIIDSITYIEDKPVHIALVFAYMAKNYKMIINEAKKYVYKIDDDGTIKIYLRNSKEEICKELPTITKAINLQKSNDEKQGTEYIKETCKEIFGYEEGMANESCAKHFYSILGRSAINMLQNLEKEIEETPDIYNLLLTANPGIQYEILKNLDWKIKKNDDRLELVNVEEWLNIMNNLEYKQYLKDKSKIKDLLDKMIERINLERDLLQPSEQHEFINNKNIKKRIIKKKNMNLSKENTQKLQYISLIENFILSNTNYNQIGGTSNDSRYNDLNSKYKLLKKGLENINKKLSNTTDNNINTKIEQIKTLQKELELIYNKILNYLKIIRTDKKAYINNQFLDIDEIDNLIEQYNNYNNKKNKKLATISTVFGKLQVVLEDNNIESSNRQYYHNI